jgi:putative GTP pyrophosphokinase
MNSNINGSGVYRRVYMENSIYGKYRDTLPLVMTSFTDRIAAYSSAVKEKTGEGLYEHLIFRVKSEESMREKCRRRGLPETPESALGELHDAIGVRIVCGFIEDVYENIRRIRELSGVEVAEEKDYIAKAKPNGYRSYHMILRVEAPFEDIRGENPGHFFIEVQLRTIAMDSWASLEHQMKYKKELNGNQALITAELKRCADELASCDLSMQTIRNLIREENQGETRKER